MSEVIPQPAKEERSPSPLEGFSFVGGVFAEADAAQVNDIKNKHQSHRTRTPELIMYSLELAGLLPSQEQLEFRTAELSSQQGELVADQEQALEAAAALRQAIHAAAEAAALARLEMRPAQFDEVRRLTSNVTPSNAPVLRIIRTMGTKHKHIDKGIIIDPLLTPTEAANCEDVFRILAAQQFASESDKISGQYGV